MRLPERYESISGAALQATVALLRRHPAGVTVQDAGPTRIEVVVVPILRGAVPRVFGDPLETVREIVNDDALTANERALAAVKSVAASDVRVRDGWAAVVARRIGGQP